MSTVRDKDHRSGHSMAGGRIRASAPVLITPAARGLPQLHRRIDEHGRDDNRVRTSLGRTGVCWDNAAAESFFASLKNEMYHRQTFATRARARFAVADYIEVFYNRQRLHSTLGYRTPHEALTDYRTAATAA